MNQNFKCFKGNLLGSDYCKFYFAVSLLPKGDLHNETGKDLFLPVFLV